MNRYLKLQNGSDIRGVAIEGVTGENVNLTTNEAFNIAISFSQWLSAKLDKPVNELSISVGSDSRLSADVLRGAMFSAFNYLGVRSLDCGIASTPSMFMSTIYDETKCDGAIMITASHLPYNRNGFKFFTIDGGLDKPDIASILTNISEDVALVSNPVASEKNNLIDLYSDMIVNIIRKEVNSANFKKPLEGMNIIVDAGNGSGGFFANKVLEVLGANTQGSQFLDPDGNFPNHIPNPEDKVAMQSITDATIKNKADLGIIFDTDVDRAAVVDKFGNQVNRNRLIALMSVIALKEAPNSIIVTDSVTSTGLSEFISNLGGVHHRFKRGYKNVINESVRLNNESKLSPLAIETSGHGAFKENYFLDDGAYIVTKILIEVAKLNLEGKDISSHISSLKEASEEKEIRVKISEPEFGKYGLTVLDAFKSLALETEGFDLESPNHEGVRVNFNKDGHSGWVLVRMSLHDPVLPINIESDKEGGLSFALEFLKRFFKSYDKLDLPNEIK